MSRSRGREIGNNHTNKRGLVTELDGENQRVRVQFADEDGVQSAWIDIIGRGSSANADFDMPDVDDEVWCALDPLGEGGCVLGTRYNKKDRPAQTDPAVKQRNFADGSVESHDTGSGTRTLDISGDVIIRAGGNIVLEAGGEITTSQGGKLTNNGKNVGHDHKHTDVTPGSGKTGEPE